MKNYSHRSLTIVMILIMLLTSITACAPKEITVETTAEIEKSEEITTSEPEVTEAPKTYLVIGKSDVPSTTVVRSNKVQKLTTEYSIFTEFRKEIGERLGGTLSINTDLVFTDEADNEDKLEIMVGNLDRAVSIELLSKVKATGMDAFGIAVKGKKIAVCGSGIYLTYLGLDYLMETFIVPDENGNNVLKIEDDFEYIATFEDAYPDPEEIMNSGKEYCFYSLDFLANVPTSGGYSVIQGGGTDGKYAYYGMINKATAPETAYIYKFDLETWELVAVSKSLPTAHTNDITYDSKHHRLVISYCSSKEGTTMSSPGIVFINPDDLSFIEYIDAPTKNRGLDYLPETNQYILAAGYNFYLTDENFNTIRSFTCGFPQNTTQGMCTDGKYIYDPRWKSGSRYQIITINTIEGNFVSAVNLYNIDGEPENIFRDGNSFVMSCNSSDNVYRLALLYKNWWD